MTHSINCKQWTRVPVFSLTVTCVGTVQNMIYKFIIDNKVFIDNGSKGIGET